MDLFEGTPLSNYRRITLAKGSFGEMEWGLYSESYRTAANKLSDYLLEKVKSGDSWDDNMVIPVIFLHRHYLEVAFKEIIFNCQKVLGKQTASINHHNILRLWDECEPLVKEFYTTMQSKSKHTRYRPGINRNGSQKGIVDGIHPMVEAFSKIDKDSCLFRYPENKNGQLYWDIKNNQGIPLKIDFDHFYSNMKRVQVQLSAISEAAFFAA